jgi:membrane protease YdiL (CAAX protease family)
MQKILSQEVIHIMQKALVMICIAIPPWLSFIKYIKDKVNHVIILLIFLSYLYATNKIGEVTPFIVVIISILFIYHKKNKEEIFFLRPLGNKKREVLIQSIGFKLIITIVNLWVAFVLMSFGIKPVPQEITQVFMKSSWTVIIYLSILTVIVAPILEEFIFRHTLYRQLSKRMGRVGACILTSCLFALLHFNFLGTISFLGVGIYNCYLYDKYGYRAAVLNHFVFNSMSTAMMIGFKIFNG